MQPHAALKDTGKQDTSILLLCLLATLKLKMARHAAKLVMEHASKAELFPPLFRWPAYSKYCPTALDILKGDEMILREVYQKQAQEYINQAKTISPKHPVVIEAEGWSFDCLILSFQSHSVLFFFFFPFLPV